MRKKISRTYFLIFFAVLALMSLPKIVTEVLKSSGVAILSPFWGTLLSSRETLAFASDSEAAENEELQRLQLENITLRNEISHIKESIRQEFKLLNEFGLTKKDPAGQERVAFLQRRYRRDLQRVVQRHLEAVPARVIFRSASSWSSSLWIDVGTSTNEALGRVVVAKNSPVVVGAAVVGVIDYVGKSQARVKLITDSGLTPSVRALRGFVQDDGMREKIEDLMLSFEKSQRFFDPQETQLLMLLLSKAKESLPASRESSLLAKGELHGSSMPLWRSQGAMLKGIGFNYDYADEEGPARDLRSGKPLDGSKKPAIPLIQPQDFLVTTGMDGVFPPGLLVAEVVNLHLLKEGDYYYELDAVPVVKNLDDLSSVFVLPPVGYDVDEQPLPVGHNWELPENLLESL